MSFDRVAAIYDATRTLPPGIVERVVDRVVAATQAGPDTRFLEIGVGTGRIAVPFVERGYRYAGVDISPQMMERLRSKASGAQNLELIEADVTALPLADQSFDVALTFHVLHLVPDWQQALREVRRVVRPGGYFVQGRDSSLPGNPEEDMRQMWRRYVEESGTALRPAYGSWDAIEADLTATGCLIANYRVAQWSEEFRPIDFLEEQRNRTYSATWDVPEDVLFAVHERMLIWAQEHFGDLRRTVSGGKELVISVSRLPP